MINITTIRKRMTKGFLLMMLFLAQSVVSSAQVKLYMENFTLSSGEKKQVSLLLDNDKTATQMQVEITLPNGMSYVDESAAKTTRVKGRGATVQASTVTGKLVIVETGGTVEAGSGEVITFEVEDKNLKVGDHKITLSNIIISDANGDQLNQEETNTVTVKKLGLGDCLFAGPENLNVVVGKEYQVDITLTNEGINNLSALQGKLTLPAGLEIVPGEEGKFIYSDRTPSPLEFTFKENEGSTSFVLSSSANQTIDGQSGVVFSFKVKASASLAENTSILLSDLRVAATSGLSADVPNVKINVVNTSVADKAAFATYQTEKTAEVEAMAKDGDSQTSLTLIANAKSAIGALTFDYALTLAENKAAVDAIVTKVTADLTAQRDQEAREKAANESLATLKTAAAALAVSDEAKAYEADNVKAAVTAAETAITGANTAVTAVETKIAEGVTAENAEALAAAIADAEQAITDAKTAIAAAEKAYADQKAADEAEAAAVVAANTKVTELKAAAADLAVSAEAKAYEADNVKTAVTAAETAIAAINPAIAAVEAKIAEGKVSTDNKEALATVIAAAEKAIADAKTAIAAAEKAYADQKALDDAAEAGAKASAEASVTALKVSMEEVVILEAAKNYDADNVKTAVAAAEQAIANANAAIKVVEDLIAEGKLATDNKVAVAQAILAAQKAVDAADDAVEVANETYKQQRTDEEAAVDDANAKVVELKAAAEALAVSAEAKAYEAENVQTAVAAAEEAITGANTAIAAVEAKIAEGKLSTDNKETLAAAIAAAEQAIADAKTAIAAAEKAYTDQKAADDAAALAAAKESLKAAITAAKAANVEGMTAATVQALNDAIAAAEAALAAETATVESLNAAKTDVEAAVAGLVVAPLFADGKYYIYNIDVQKYLAAGSSWGTHAVVNATGLDYTLTLADGKYTMDSQVSNGGNKHFLNGEWNDGDAMGWTFEAVEGKEGVYTISNGTQFLTAQENGEVLLKEDATVEAAQWTLKTVEARVAELAAATAEAPVDASFLITDANFGRNDLRKSAWTTEASNLNMSGGNNTNNCAESYHSVFSLSQTLTNLPKGVYALTAQGFYRQDGQDNDNLPVFFANNEAITFPAMTGSENNMSQASESFTAGNYTIAPIYVQVAEDGQLTVGAKLEENTALWCIWDNFQLTYYGADADIEQLKNAAIIAELAALREQLAEKKDQVEVEVVKTEAENALTATADVTGTDAINAAVETLKAALDKVEASLDAKAKLANMKELVDATNVYTAEAKNEYYDQWVVKYNDGTITKAEANALQDPFIVTGWHANITVDNFLLSAWDTNPDFQDAPYYINSWSIEGESDGSNFKVPFFEYWTNDDSSLGEKTLTATMNGLEAGEYNVTAWVRVRMKNGAEAPATGVKLQANDGEAVDVCDGEAFGPMYVKEVAATGTVAEDGVLKIKFNVAADNNVSWLSFKNVKFEKKAVEIAHTWNFTKWSEATIANLKADAAASKVAGWSDVEKKADAEAGNDAPEATKDNCFWAVIPEGGELTANGVVIEELKGLQFGTTFAGNRSLAIAVNYPTTSLGTYAGPAYLWLGGKNFECFTIPAVKGGTTIKMGVESHKLTDARGVQLFAGETELKDADGNAVAAPTTYTEQTWVVPAGVAYDIVVKNTNGCHIYFIDAEQDEQTLTSINTVKSSINDGVIYNLNGQKVSKALKGLFIINGKKVVIK